MRILSVILLVAVLLLSAACSPTLVEVTPPNLDEVARELGYSLAPSLAPEGFEFENYQILGDESDMLFEPFVSLHYKIFKDYSYHGIMIKYPYNYPPADGYDNLLERLGIAGWQRPDDAVCKVKVNGESAHLVKGMWSSGSISHISKPDPEFLATYTPVWDYDFCMSLYFNFELHQGETIGVMIMAMMSDSEDWITTGELVGMAESFPRTD
jgi:hypothetical protein